MMKFDSTRIMLYLIHFDAFHNPARRWTKVNVLRRVECTPVYAFLLLRKNCPVFVLMSQSSIKIVVTQKKCSPFFVFFLDNFGNVKSCLHQEVNHPTERKSRRHLSCDMKNPTLRYLGLRDKDTELKDIFLEIVCRRFDKKVFQS